MMLLELTLRPVQVPQLSVPTLQRSIQALQKITSHLSESGSLDTPDQLAEVRESLQRCHRVGGDFAEFTRVCRRESRILSVYLMDLEAEASRKLLPAFDEEVAVSTLGNGRLKRHLRTQATLLYFTHCDTDRIEALAWLSDRLRQSWRYEDKKHLFDETSKAYQRHANELFASDAPTRVSFKYQEGESFDHFAQRYGIPPAGKFRERLLGEVVLKRVRKASSDGIEESLDELVRGMKNHRMQSGYPLGAEAAQILIDRSIDTFNGKVPDAWKGPIVAYTCDPRVPSPAEQTRWWGWANRMQKEVAIRALTELTLRQFISLLRDSLGGTAAGEPFKERAKMLLRIFELGKVIDARLVVYENTYFNLPDKTKQTLMPCRTSGGNQHTSFVVLKCTDNVILTEGTHSFALRGFIGEDRFPVRELWSSATGSYFHDSKFRVSKQECDIFERHMGDWLGRFNNQLRTRHIEWRGLYD